MKIKGKNKHFDLIICSSFRSRLLGNMFKKNISNVLCFPKCKSIHTLFVKKPIDVIMLDKQKKVLYIFPNFPTYRVIMPKKKVFYTLEFPEGENPYKLNDIVKF